MATLDDIRNAELPVIFVCGGPGSGKGTQCAKIAREYGLAHLSVGETVRGEEKLNSSFGVQLKELGKGLNREEVLDRFEGNENVMVDFVTHKMVEAFVSQSPKGFLIDGHPRQEDIISRFEVYLGKVSKIVYFEASAITLEKRLNHRREICGQARDNQARIAKRLDYFNKFTRPIIERFEKYGEDFVRVDAEGSVDEVFQRACLLFDPMFKQ